MSSASRPKDIKFSICILNWNRKDDILCSLEKIYTTNYVNYEVILVDNDSSDGTVEAVSNAYPKVKIIQNLNNGIEGWNRAFNVANGEYFLALDNDSHPDENTLDKIENIFTNNMDVDIIACNVLVRSSNGDEFKSAMRFTKPIGHGLTQVYDFIGCGVAIRKKVITNIGGFADYLFMYGHETEFSLRALRLGYKIVYSPEVIVYHRVSTTSRPSGMSSKYIVSNFVTIAWIYFPALYALDVTIELLIESLVLAMLNSNITAYLEGIKRIIANRDLIINKRRPLAWSEVHLFSKHFPFSIGSASKRFLGLM
jgi:GT2 family glycosyltransferase